MNNQMGLSNIDWIKELVHAEDKMEETGIVDLSIGQDTDRALVQASLQLLSTLKQKFVESSVTFNDLKASALGRLKIYGIAKTPADFMLFRNGYKMIFSLNAPGEVAIRFNFMGNTSYIPTQIPTSSKPGESSAAAKLVEENILKAKFGPFGDLRWTFKDQQVQIDNIVRYHMTLFIRESAK